MIKSLNVFLAICVIVVAVYSLWPKEDPASHWQRVKDEAAKASGHLLLNPPQKDAPFNKDAPTFTTSFETKHYGGPVGQTWDWPYLGHFFKVQQMVPLEESEKTGYVDRYDKILQIDLGPKKYWLFVVPGSLGQVALLYNENGQFVTDLFTDASFIETSQASLLTKLKSHFQLYRVRPHGFDAPVSVQFRKVLQEIQKEAFYAESSSSLGCSDFLFKRNGNLLHIWMLNVSTTAILPEYLHLKLSCDLSKGNELKIEKRFGTATFANRLPTPQFLYDAAFFDGALWVPRTDSAQIDIFDTDGNLLKTASLEPLRADVCPIELLPTQIISDVFDHDDPNVFHGLYRKYPFISAVNVIGDALVATRFNMGNNQYDRFFNIIDKDAAAVSPDMFGFDFLFAGDNGKHAFLMIRSRKDVTIIPPWLSQAEIFDKTAWEAQERPWIIMVAIDEKYQTSKDPQ